MTPCLALAVFLGLSAVGLLPLGIAAWQTLREHRERGRFGTPGVMRGRRR